jgi:cytochrome c551/c552
MKLILPVLIFLIAGCAGNDKKTPTDNVLPPINIEGETLFKNNCASCHKPDRDFVGPGLKGSLEKWGGDKKAMYDFIRDPSQDQNEYVSALKKKWAPAIMTSFKLSDAELDSVMNFCQYYVRPTSSVESVPDK